MAIRTMVFETEDCTRCGGSGRYAFNGKHSRCYKCNGKGRQISRNGALAKQAKEELIIKRLGKLVSDFKPGESVFLTKDIDYRFREAGYYRVADSYEENGKWVIAIEGKANVTIKMDMATKLRMHNPEMMEAIYREIAANYKGATLIED